MVFRIHFTAEDLARTRVAEAPMPLVELKQAARALQDRRQPARLSGWRRHSLAKLSAPARLALDFIPAVGWSPTFIGAPQAGSPEELIEQVRATPTPRIQTALDTILPQNKDMRVPALTRRLTDPVFLGDLCDGLGDLFETLLAPYWSEIIDAFTADRSVRMRQVLHGGVEHLLSQANPQRMRWNAPVLEIATPGDNNEYNLPLEGRGLLLVPSTMPTTPAIHYDAEPQPAVIYPAGHGHPLRLLTAFTPKEARTTGAPAVAALLGHTRATVLTLVAEHPGCSTRELAAFAGLAPSSASEHATVLREAGLITTTRFRNAALHSPTRLGIDLLNHAPGRSLGRLEQ
ncbi:winged helix-turn-helix domain-containing protein [Streptomyces sp. NPDC005760]|uniref:winged helix-turn-helix domain-containing protein n=1 Tax=Streptomyces sp. NPDC005760 TaxID=3156718 RepID=UPI0033CBDFD2